MYNEKETIKIAKEKVKEFIKPKEKEYFDEKEIMNAIEEETYQYFEKCDEIDEDTLHEVVMEYLHYALCLVIKMRVLDKVYDSIIPIAKKNEKISIIYDYKKDELSYIDSSEVLPDWSPVVIVFEVSYDCNKEICRDCHVDCSFENKYDSKHYRMCYNEFIDYRIFEDDSWMDEIRNQLDPTEWKWDMLWD